MMLSNLRHGKFPVIKDVLPLANGLWEHVTYDFPDYMEISKAQLDYLFLASYGMKNPAPVIDLIHEDPFSKLTDSELTQLASMMVNYYKPKWDKLAEVYNVEYDPIHNYLDEWEDESDDTRDIDVTVDKTIADTLNTTVTDSSTRTDNLAEVEQHDLASSNERSFTNYKEKNDYHSGTEHIIDAQNPMVEEIEYGKTDERTDDFSVTHTGSENTANSGTDTNSVWGFNSGSAVNSDALNHGHVETHTINDTNPLKDTTEGTVTHALTGRDTKTNTGQYSDDKTGYDELTKSGKINDAGTDTGVLTTNNTGTQTIAGTKANTGTNTRDVDETNSTDESGHRERSGRHFGNIGNLTSQKMIKEEIELWKWSFIQSILEDARDFLTLQVWL